MIIYLLSGICAVALLCLHLLGNDGYYFIYSWYDIMMHILGGLTIGLLAYQVAKSHLKPAQFSAKKIVIAVFLIGLAWEIFEAIFDIAGAPVGTKAYYIDTVKDLMDDCIGAILAINIAGLINKIPWIKKSN